MDSSQFKPKTLDQISDALDAVETARGKKGLNATEKSILQTASLKLRNLERSVEDSIQDELVDTLSADTSGLQDLIAQIGKSSKKLDKLATILEKTAKVVDAFAKIVVTAVGAGLL